MQQQARALQMAQELMSQTRAFSCTLDETGYVGNDEAAVLVRPHHAQVGMQGSEGIIGNFRARRRHGADVSRFACVGHAQKTDVGQNLEFEFQATAFAGRTRGALARRTIGTGFEVNVAQSALTAPGKHRGLPVPGQISEHFARLQVANYGAHRKMQGNIIGGLAVAVAPAPLLAITRAMYAGITVLDERIDVAVCDREYAAAAAAVAAVRAAAWNEFLAPETRDAVAAVAGMDLDNGFVDEFHPKNCPRA